LFRKLEYAYDYVSYANLNLPSPKRNVRKFGRPIDDKKSTSKTE